MMKGAGLASLGGWQETQVGPEWFWVMYSACQSWNTLALLDGGICGSLAVLRWALSVKSLTRSPPGSRAHFGENRRSWMEREGKG